MKKDDKILVVGYSKMVNDAMVNCLTSKRFTNLHTVPATLDLTRQSLVHSVFKGQKPDYVFLTGGEWAGLFENARRPADFIYNQTQIYLNIIHSAWKVKVKKLLFLASSCVYPENCPQPMKEEYLMTGILEPISEPSALARIMGIRMCQFHNRQYGTNFISVVPTGMYGPHDDFCPETGHVLPALIEKFHKAKVNNEPAVTVFGSGKPYREWIYADDVADACLFLMENYNSSEIINIGVGADLTIGELAELVREVVDYRGEIVFDTSRADGAYRKLMDYSKLYYLGWRPKTLLIEGVQRTYKWYLKNAGATS